MKKYAALFGGSGKDQNSKEYKETVEIGKYLAQKGYLVKNGGYGGMMEAVSKGVSEANGESIGLTCRQVGTAEGNPFLSKTQVTETLYERLQLFIEDTQVFIVQKGGIGTLSEVFLTLDVIRKLPKGQRPKMYLMGNCWLNVMNIVKTELIPEYEHDLFEIFEDVEELLEKIDE